jgi:hypothetical protein
MKYYISGIIRSGYEEEIYSNCPELYKELVNMKAKWSTRIIMLLYHKAYCFK